MGKIREAEERNQRNRLGTHLRLFHVQTYYARPWNILVTVPVISAVRM